ncbi:flagellar hook-length control protein FliK [uncultured Roseibium sp.]|uniref:flagellar hook-length control protein FliK n=1 Tax=uncultured Roseibium sp. TaxID=1936171 RepID=UPI003216457B
MLPVGLITDVSAGALGVGAGAAGIGAAGPFPELPGDTSAFAATLGALGGSTQGGGLAEGASVPGLDQKTQKASADGAQAVPTGLEALLQVVPTAQPSVATGLDLGGEGAVVDGDGTGSASASADVGGKAAGATGAAGAGSQAAGGFVPQVPPVAAGQGAPQAPADPAPAGQGQAKPVDQAAAPVADPSGAVTSPEIAPADDAAPVVGEAGQQAGGAQADDAVAETVVQKGVSPEAQPSANAVPVGKDAAAAAVETTSAKEPGQQAADPQRKRRWQSELPEDIRSTRLKQSLAADAAQAQQVDSNTTSDTAGIDGSKKTATATGELLVVPVSGKDKPSSTSTQSANSPAQVSAAAGAVPASGPAEGGEVALEAGKPQSAAAGPETLQSRKPASNSAVADGGQASANPAVEALDKQIAKKAADQAVSDQAVADEAALDDPDAVDPGEPVPVANKAAKGTSAADTADLKTAAASGDATSRAAERNALAAAANSGLANQAVDADADVDPDGQLTLSLNLRADGSNGPITTGRADMQQVPTQSQAGHVATQVASGIVRHLQNGQTQFQMRLDPPELGRVDVDLKVAHDGRVHAHLIVDRPETLDLFMRDQRGLERALQNAGLDTNADNLSFSLNDSGSQQSGFSQGEGDQAYSGDTAGPAAEDTPELSDAQNIQVAVRSQQGGLDIRI